MTRKVPRRKLKKPLKRILLLVSTLLISYFLIKFAYNQYEIHQLKEIGYQSSTIKLIDQHKLRNTLINRGEYSKTLEDALINNEVYLDYLNLYFIRDEVSLEITQVYQRLEEKGYPIESLETLFSQLNFRELTPLLVFDFQNDVAPYIEDVIKNRSTNINQFVLSNNYFTPYDNPLIADISQPYAIFVSKQYQLPKDYSVQLVNVSIGCRMSLMQLEEKTAEAFESMCSHMQSLGMKIASTSAYRSFEYQNDLYLSITKEYGIEAGERRVIRAGFSEHETGLAVDIASLTTPDVPFVQSRESDWLIENAHTYGFINHYQKGYEQITGIQYESWHYRYVGIELATKIYESGLTFDEYYLLHLSSPQEVDNHGN